jgi:hypothetical protein
MSAARPVSTGVLDGSRRSGAKLPVEARKLDHRPAAQSTATDEAPPIPVTRLEIDDVATEPGMQAHARVRFAGAAACLSKPTATPGSAPGS